MQSTEVAVIEQPIDHALRDWSTRASSIARPPAKLSPSSSPNTAACIRAIIRAEASITTAPANWPSG